MSVTEIARKAGVSIATVSRVLNGHPRVRPETAQQVRRALEELRYVRPPIRRGPKLGRRAPQKSQTKFGNIAVLSAGVDQRFFQIPLFAAALTGVVRAARPLSLNVLLDHIDDPSHLSPAIRDGDVDGAVLILPAHMETSSPLVEALRRQMPVVRMMGESLGTTGVDHVGPDNNAVGELAFRYLAARGCREIAFVGLEHSWDVHRSRAFGFMQAASRLGVYPTCYILASQSQDVGSFGTRMVRCQSPAEIVDRLATASPRPDGLFIARDIETARLYPLLHARNLIPGRDVTVISCDNDEGQLSMLHPRPVSIDLDPEEIGRRALLRLGTRISKPDEPPLRVLVMPRILPAEGIARSPSAA